MKHFSRWGLLVALPVLAFTTHAALAFEGPLDLLRSLSHGFFLHGPPGYLGVDLRDVGPDRATALKLKDPHGAEVLTVDHDAPAAKAGLRVHDVILQMDGQQVSGCDQLRRMLRKQSPGRTVSFLISRDGNAVNITVQLADRAQLERQAWSQHFSVPDPSGNQQMSEGSGFVASGFSGGPGFLGTLIPNSFSAGVDVNPVRTQLADYFGVTSGTGLLVENVDSQSPARRAGLQAGDVILKVNSTPMIRRNDWLKAIHDNRGKLVQVVIMRNKQQQTLTMLAGNSKKHE